MMIVDSMLGKLSKYLRMMGYDIEYVENDKDDSFIINKSEGCLVITRDKLLHDRIKNSIFLKSYRPLDQLRELKDKLPKPEHNFMELCSICGSVLEKTNENASLPDYVNKQAKEIFYCKKCDKFYWEGGHTDNFRKMVERIGFEVH
jgi:uncharacterized protein with PIN domain